MIINIRPGANTQESQVLSANYWFKMPGNRMHNSGYQSKYQEIFLSRIMCPVD